MLQLSILGPIEICGDAGEIKVTAQRQRALLELLLLDANRVLPTDLLIDRLWGERPPRTAATSLQNTIAQLRRLLGADVVKTRSPGYVLQVDPDQLDLARFEHLRARARAEGPTERAQTLRDALDLWRGDPLADLAFEPCVQDEIRRLAGLRLDALEERIGADLAIGRYAEVVSEVEGLVALHGDRQKLVAHLMLALHQAGRDIEANDAFHACSRLLDEVGLLPRQELQELHRGILRHDPALQPPAAGGSHRHVDRYSQVVRALLAARLVPVLAPQAATTPSASAPPDPARRSGTPRAGLRLPGRACPGPDACLAVHRGNARHRTALRRAAQALRPPVPAGPGARTVRPSHRGQTVSSRSSCVRLTR